MNISVASPVLIKVCNWFNPCWIVLNLMSNIYVALFFTLFSLKMHIVSHYRLTWHFILIKEVAMVLIRTRPSVYWLTIAFAEKWRFWKSLILIEIALVITLLFLITKYFLVMYIDLVRIYVLGCILEVITFIGFGDAAVFGGSLVWWPVIE